MQHPSVDRWIAEAAFAGHIPVLAPFLAKEGPPLFRQVIGFEISLQILDGGEIGVPLLEEVRWVDQLGGAIPAFNHEVTQETTVWGGKGD